MKYLIVITMFCSYFLSNSSEKVNDFRPPGTAKIVDNFFFDVREMTNIDWKEYLSDLKTENGENSEIFLEAHPDTLVWRDEASFDHPFVENYFQNPAYDSYPVVGISHKQAVAYCIWRTKAVKKMMEVNNKEPVNFKYRLPTQTEWELVASAGYSNKQKKIFNKHNKKYGGKARKCNMLYAEQTQNNTFKMLSQSRSYLPNKYNIYNIYGNVAEMVAEQNIALGGSFLDRYEEIVPSNKVLQYDGPQRWLGLRCAAEIFD